MIVERGLFVLFFLSLRIEGTIVLTHIDLLCSQSEHGWRDPRKLFYVVGGLILALGELLFGELPGPGTLTFFIGLGMIAISGFLGDKKVYPSPLWLSALRTASSNCCLEASFRM